jgi:hypothetical protein
MNSLRPRLARSAVLSLVLICAATAGAGAEVQISGGADSFVLRARNATMAEVLSGIHSALDIGIEATGSPARQFTGTYSGSLRHVLSRLLEGENYVIRTSASGVDIIFVGPRSGGQRLLLAAGDRGENNSIQGWTGAVGFNTAAVPAKPVGSPPSDAAQQPKVVVADNESENPIQGWVSTGNPFKIARASGAPAVADPTAQTTGAGAAAEQAAAAGDGDSDSDSEAVNPVQGWVSTGNPFKIAAPSSVPREPEDQATAMAVEDDGNPNLQGYDPSAVLRGHTP